GPAGDPEAAGEGNWDSDGEMVRAAHELHAEDDDFGQPGTLVREVMDDAARERLVTNISGSVSGVRSEDIRERAFQYWEKVDADIGRRVREAVGALLATADANGGFRSDRKLGRAGSEPAGPSEHDGAAGLFLDRSAAPSLGLSARY